MAENHIGQRIKELISKKGITITEFSKKIHCSRRTAYELFEKNSIDSDLLFRISILLNENLFDEINKQTEQVIKQNNPDTQNITDESINKETVSSLIDLNKKTLVKLELINSNINSIKEILVEFLQEKRS